jgi:uncharacterized protein (DUF433 family)
MCSYEHISRLAPSRFIPSVPRPFPFPALSRRAASAPARVLLKVRFAVAFPGEENENLAVNLLERITVEPGKCGGRPCIRGERIRLTDILDLLSHGASHEEILQDYSFLEPDDIFAAIAYASRLTDHVVLRTA